MAWVPSPSYLLRRWTVLRELRGLPRNRLLEIGCGAGELFAHLLRSGYRGCAVETSSAARREARRRVRDLGGRGAVRRDLEEVEGRFDLILACEVLEHVEEDLATLRRWVERLAPGGRVLLTVPAHPRRFGASDVWAGHYRRYGRGDLLALARDAGLRVDRLLCFGFPLGNLIEPVRNLVNAYRLRHEEAARSERTARSGVERGLEHRLRFLFPAWAVLPFCWLQLPFLKLDLGTGFLLVASRRS